MSAVYTIYTSPDHVSVPDHLPTLIVTPHGKPQQILYTYLHTNYNRENYLLTPSPQGDLCVAKLFPPPSAQLRPSGGKSASEGHGSAGSSSTPRTVKCEASRNFRWSITNSGVLTPTYKCTLPADDGPEGMTDEQPLFQISKTNPQSPFWTMSYYAYAGHLIPPKRIQFGHISKSVTPDGKPVTGGGTRVTITGKSDDEKAVWKTLGDGNEDMVEWAVICAALHVLDDEIVKAAEAAGIRIGVLPGSNLKSAHHSSTPPPMPNGIQRPQLHPTGVSQTRAANIPQEMARSPPQGMPMPLLNGRRPPPPPQQQQNGNQDPRLMQQDPRMQQQGPPPMQRPPPQMQMQSPQMQMPPPQQRGMPPPGSQHGSPMVPIVPPPRQHIPFPGDMRSPPIGGSSTPHQPQQLPLRQQQPPMQQGPPPPGPQGDGRARLLSRNGPRPQMPPQQEQLPPPQQQQGPLSPPYNPRPGPLSQQGRANGAGGLPQVPPQYSNGRGPSPRPDQGGSISPRSGDNLSSRSAPPASLNALRSKQSPPTHGGPLPPPGSMPDDYRGFNDGQHPAPFAQVQPVPQSPRRDRFNGPPPQQSPSQGMSSRMSDPPMSKPPPRRSSAQAAQQSMSPQHYQGQPQQQQYQQPGPPPQQQQYQAPQQAVDDDMVDSVAFMLGTTALNDAGALGDEEIGPRSAGPVSSNGNGNEPSRSRVGRLLRNR